MKQGNVPRGAYFALSEFYDRLNSETDYSAWADFFGRAFGKFSPDKKICSVLDLGCGTGAMTLELCRRGYDMTALDISCDMLSVARDNAAEAGLGNILWLCQDMRAFELYSTVDAVVCCLDGINHLYGATDLSKCFSLVHNYLDPNGIFIFDVNTPYKFKNFYKDNDYILEDDGVTCCWQNSYDSRRGLCDFYLSVFRRRADGAWDRTDTVQRERCYTEKKLRAELERAGFEVLGFFGDFEMNAPKPDCSRWYIAAKAKK